MGLWQNLVESYDKNAEALKIKYPLSTTTISNNADIIAVVTIDGEGNFIRSDKIEKAKKDKTGNCVVSSVQICIPVSEKSMGRAGSIIAPHPVFDQYEYLIGSGKKFETYLSGLEKLAKWEHATQQVNAIYHYIAQRRIKTDLEKIAPNDKTTIVFEVEIPGDTQTKVWENKSFFEAWNKYYLKEKRSSAEKKKLIEEGLTEKKKLNIDDKKKMKESTKIDEKITIDYITGILQPVATSHPKKISNASANSKLVSDNDNTNFTFRGKFNNSSEAVAIGYESSQKSHQFLRYLINDHRGFFCGEQIILSFTIGSTEKTLPPPVDDKSISSILQESIIITENDSQISLRAETGFDYAVALRKSLTGYGYGKTLKQHTKTALIALDAATTGRLSITFYRELDRNEYVESIADWHSSCKWNFQFWSAENQKMVSYVGAPSVDKIIEAVYGKPRGKNDESYIKIKKAARERLLRCIFDKAFLPRDYVTAAIRRASNPMSVKKKDKFDRRGFEQVLSTACALIRKEINQSKKEEYKLNIELDRTDRDYLYGRLLGAADKLEEYALYKKDNDRVVTAAIRHMQAFAQHPFRTWQTIHGCLNPYIQRVKGSFAFNEIEAIKNKFVSVDEYEKDTSLDGSYLIGYYHERAFIGSLVAEAISKKQSAEHNEKEDGNDGQ
ncbi:MAG: type I-C CRISPR-associated protein Cas8c/Csd1 [Chitinispirillaceae bacterium]|nr:type I-C CRISPR-associated protein Cas8c/Csd1 [Chitinispirillaceae bacterium]